MAQTLPNGVVVPNADGGETISSTGVAEMRTLGSSADGHLATRPTTAVVDAKLAVVAEGANLPVRSTTNGQDLNNALEPQILRHTTATGVLNLPPWDTSYSSAAITFIQVLNIKEGTTSYASQVA